MSAPDRKGFDAEAILNDLYASKINASISWIWDGGFHVILGAPPQAEGWALPTIRDAVVKPLDRAGREVLGEDIGLLHHLLDQCQAAV